MRIETLPVTAYQQITKPYGTQRTLIDFARALTVDTPEKRKAREAEGEELRLAKQNLPAWLLGGTTDGRVSNDSVTTNGVLTLDIDHAGSAERVATIKGRLAQLPFVIIAATSCSGKGVFACLRVSEGLQRDKERIKYLAEVMRVCVLGDAAKFGGEIDPCFDVARRRFESYDPEPFVNFDCVQEFKEDFAGECERAFKASRIYKLACMYNGPDKVHAGSVNTCLALASLAVAAGGRVYGNALNAGYYPFKFQGVVLGKSGAGKTTGINAIRKIVAPLGANEIRPESDRALAYEVTYAAADPVFDTTTKKARVITDWTIKPIPTPLLALFDEAGSERASRRNREYKSGLDALRRELFGKTFTPSSSLNTQLIKRAVRSSYTDVQFSTVKAWSQALHGIDTTAGDARRVLEFWAEGVETLTDDPVCAFMLSLEQTTPEPESAKIIQILEELKCDLGDPDADGASVKYAPCSSPAIHAQGALKAAEFTCGDVLDDAKTIVANLATAACFARRGEFINDEDALVAWEIALAVMRNRQRLANDAEMLPETREKATMDGIIDWIKGHTHGESYPRLYCLKRSLASGGRPALCALEYGLQQGLFAEVKDGRSVCIRVTTADEYEARQTEIERARAEAEALVTRTENTNAQAQTAAPASRSLSPEEYPEYARDYLSQTPGERENRAIKYVTKYLQANPVAPGNRNNAINKLIFQLQKIGMWDSITEDITNIIAENSGLGEKEIKTLLRERRIAKH